MQDAATGATVAARARGGGVAEVGGAAGTGRGAAVWTVPNLLSALRLAGVPVFLWLVLGPRSQTDGLVGGARC